MSDWFEINRISNDPQAVRSLARRLLSLRYLAWSEEMLLFLNAMAHQHQAITIAQAAYLTRLWPDFLSLRAIGEGGQHRRLQ